MNKQFEVQHMTVQLSFRNVQNVSVKSKFHLEIHLEIHYPNSSRGNKHATFLFYDSSNVTQYQGDSRTSISMSVSFVEFHGINFSY